MPVRVRFAPSPTGPISLGNVRTALFNWLFARHEGGLFLLRIEDTDKERSKKEYEEDLLLALKWLGLDWDEDPLRQSERLLIYEKNLKKLLTEKKAYYCFCSTEELESERQAQLTQGLQPKYSGKCRTIPYDEAGERAKKEPSVIRFRMPEGEIAFVDLIRGRVSFDTGLIGDTIIAKNLRTPLYNFAVVIDDSDMGITHVIRGEDHISNTPKQIAIAEALGIAQPHYAHLPLILGPDHKKLSKRYLDASFNEYQQKGYLAPAMVNFLALLGWHPAKDREVLSREEIIAEFGFKRVQKSGAIFNPEKLDWLNSHYIKNSPPEELVEGLADFVPKEWLKKKKILEKAVSVERERMKKLSDFKNLADFFFELPDYKKELLIWKGTPDAAILDNLRFVLDVIKKIPPGEFEKETIEKYVTTVAEKRGRGEVFWPLRAALSGREASPGPSEIMEIIGPEESENRIKTAIGKLES
ncbi:MAG: glutamate--tRNA ligase [Minisyncoccia bacterium]|jgi:glutamyl-tRNA synthetase